MACAFATAHEAHDIHIKYIYFGKVFYDYSVLIL